MAEMELHGTHDAKDYERQSRGLENISSQDNDEQQLDVLSRLGKLPVLKVSHISWLLGEPCGADIHSAISVSCQSWALRVPF